VRARREVLAGRVVLIAVGAAFFLGSFAYDWTGDDGTIGPAVLPRTAGLLLVLVGIALVVQEVRSGAERDDEVVGVVEGVEEPDPEHTRRKLGVVLAAMLGTALLIPITGLLPTLALLTLFLCAVVERQPLPRSLGVAAGVGVLGHLLFVVLLRVPLPYGVFDPAVWSLL
jgi:Tripartite tricarboxylate transporter TctB family